MLSENSNYPPPTIPTYLPAGGAIICLTSEIFFTHFQSHQFSKSLLIYQDGYKKNTIRPTSFVQVYSWNLPGPYIKCSFWYGLFWPPPLCSQNDKIVTSLGSLLCLNLACLECVRFCLRTLTACNSPISSRGRAKKSIKWGLVTLIIKKLVPGMIFFVCIKYKYAKQNMSNIS